MTFTIYESIPQRIEAIQWDDTIHVFEALTTALPGKVRDTPGGLQLLAGVDGAQGWVPVPVGHWVVRLPGDASDVWPVDPGYFASKYRPFTPPGTTP